MSKPELTDEAKMLIQKYLINKFLVWGTVVSIISFLLGFFIKDIAKAEAYNEAYSEAAQMIIQLTNNASESANKIKNLEAQFNQITIESEKVLKDATELRDKVKTTLVIQQSSEIVSDVSNNLSNNINFQNSIIKNTSSRIDKLEAKTKNMSIDESGRTIFKNDVKAYGYMEAYDFALKDTPKK